MGYKEIWYVFGDEFVDELGDLLGGGVGEVGKLDICGNEGDVFLVWVLLLFTVIESFVVVRSAWYICCCCVFLFYMA